MYGYNSDEFLIYWNLGWKSSDGRDYYSGVRTIDITDSHDECEKQCIEDPFLAQVVLEHNDYCSRTKSKESKNQLRPLDKHFLVKMPHFSLGLLSPETMIEYSKLDCDWQKHAAYIIKYIVNYLPPNDIMPKLEILHNYFNIDCKDYNINFILRNTQFDGVSTLAEKVEHVIFYGMKFSIGNIDIDVIAKLDNDVIEQLINNGLNIIEMIEQQPIGFMRLSDNLTKNIMNYVDDVERVTKCILSRYDGLFRQLKNLALNYNSDIIGILSNGSDE
jgi:hypothetical protein